MIRVALALASALASTGVVEAQFRSFSFSGSSDPTYTGGTSGSSFGGFDKTSPGSTVPDAPAPPTDSEPSTQCNKAHHLSVEDAEFDLQKCPSLEPQTALSRPGKYPDNYDPKDVDWRSLVKAIEYVANKEKRYCNFVIRAHFHDAGSLGNDAPAPASVYGSDGSMHLDKFEFLQPENAYDAFSLFSRTVNTELVRFYGASYADVLNVAAFTCVKTLGGKAYIPLSCDGAGIPLYAGKLDSDFDFSKDMARARTNHLPGNFQETPIWMNFWLNVLNNKAESPKWKFNMKDALALMGSHTLIDNQACTTTGKQLTTAPKTPADEGCSGTKRMFQWINSYFKDGSSGTCEPRPVTPESARWFPTSSDNSKGRDPTEAEEAELAKCPWTSKAGFEMGKNLQCVVHRGAAELGIGEIPEDNDFKFVDWKPDSSRYPCCGYHCQTCAGNDHEDPYYCPNSPKGTSFWFYTWQDCDLIYSTRQGADSYCDDSSKKCGEFNGDFGKQLTELGKAYALFTGNNLAWQTEYAHGHCKLNNIGAVYSKHKTPLFPLLDQCKGGYKDGKCASDPVNGIVKKITSCVGSDKELDLTQMIQKRSCKDCSDAMTEPIALPDDGDELQIGETIEKNDGELITVVGDDGH